MTQTEPRAWKPGDVALAFDDDWRFVVVRHDGAGLDYWSAADGRWPIGVSADLLDYRPLVVIDPEDREQVERFAIRQQHFYYESGASPATWNDLGSVQQNAVIDATQAALREFANLTPPKPDEPTGLGAVVEDAIGLKWVAGPGVSGGRRWQSEHASGLGYYADINAVRILSPGVEVDQ